MTCRYQLGKTSDYNFSCCCSVAKLCPTLCDPWTAASQASLSFTISWSLFKLMSIESVMLSNSLIVCHPLLLFPSIFPSIRVFSMQSQLFPSGGQNIRALISASVLQMSIKWGLIFFRIDWFDLLAVQGTLKSLLQPQFKSINSLALSLLYGPSLTTIHDYLKNHSFNYTDFCQQSDASAF